MLPTEARTGIDSPQSAQISPIFVAMARETALAARARRDLRACTGVASMKFGIATRLFLAFAGIAAYCRWLRAVSDGGFSRTWRPPRRRSSSGPCPRWPTPAWRRRSPGELSHAAPGSPTRRPRRSARPRRPPCSGLPSVSRQALNRNVEYGYSETELETLRVTAERLRENLSAQNALVTARIDADRASRGHRLAGARSGARVVRPVRDPGFQRGGRHHRGDFQPVRAGGVRGPYRGKPGGARSTV